MFEDILEAKANKHIIKYKNQHLLSSPPGTINHDKWTGKKKKIWKMHLAALHLEDEALSTAVTSRNSPYPLPIPAVVKRTGCQLYMPEFKS